ncbi:MAG TPA: hypothetical protein VLA71_09645 [Algoriphagus sp.]|nr:hypothetical protein [Algoriphagus sp.]
MSVTAPSYISSPVLFLGKNGTVFNPRMVHSEYWNGYGNPLTGLPNSRVKLKINSAKKRLLAKLSSQALQLNKEDNLIPETEETKDFRIDYMPLCCEEDLEMYAAFQAEEKKNYSNSPF